ncbi:MAG: hypothetical protein ABI183_16245 [Polyangiaceae bacterium]
MIKRRAASTLDELLREQFKGCACPITIPIEIPGGGRVTFQSAYDDLKGDLVLLIGSWEPRPGPDANRRDVCHQHGRWMLEAECRRRVAGEGARTRRRDRGDDE